MSAPWKFDLYVDGKWGSGEGSGVIDVIDPATEESIGQVPEATVGDARRAIEAARRAFDDGPWPWMKPRERAAILVRMAEVLERRSAELRELIVDQTGSVGFHHRFRAGRRLDRFVPFERRSRSSTTWNGSCPIRRRAVRPV